jgi:DNA-binding response OmpR family regulator
MARKILVVDDEQHIVRLLEVNLARAGYEVITADNGREALEKAEDEGPDLITLDDQMPGEGEMDGFETLQELQHNLKTKDIPVVMIASGSTDADVFRGWQAGVSAYLAKPLNPLEVLTHIKRIFEAREEGDAQELDLLF